MTTTTCEHFMSKTGIRRMRILIDYMRSLPPKAGKHFDMNCYFKGDGPRPGTPEEIMTCGTTACAAGWAMVCPKLKRLFPGMLSGLTVIDAFHMSDKFSIFSGANTFEAFFGPLNHDKTPKAWARRAERLLDRIERDMSRKDKQ